VEYTVTKYQGFEIWNYPVIDSTNEQAKRVAADNFVIVAASQTAGKGRGGKSWISDDGNLFFSIILDASRLKNPEIISFVAALSVANAIEKNGASCLIKWPNDVLVENKKCCGILLEKHKNNLIVGIGININSAPEYLDSGRSACCLSEYLKDVDNDKILKQILAEFSNIFEEYKRSDFVPIREKILSKLYKLNEFIELDQLGKKHKGRIIDISPSGNLVLETDKGRQEYSVGEIFGL
jgi:BirA family biotin operon repressor/biotin-[acetyl-CoA-carboxylase] ligase